MVELRQLRYFVAVAKALHFSRAAERLQIAQPALSRQVGQLERELGVELLRRTKRRVELTDAGKAFLEEAQRTLAQAERTAEAARRAQRGEIGQLILGFEGAVAYDLLPRILAAYRLRFPSVKLVLEQMGTAEQVPALRDGRIDVGLLCPEVRDPALAFETVAREPYRVVLPERHPLATRPQVLLAALADEDFVLFPRWAGVVAYDQIISMCERAGFNPRVTQEAVRYVTIVGLVSAGLGVSLVASCVESFRHEGVVFRPLVETSFQLERVMAWHRDAPSEALAGFLDVARATCAAAGTISRKARLDPPGRGGSGASRAR